MAQPIMIYTVDHNGDRTWLPQVYASIGEATAAVRKLETDPAIAAAVPATKNLPRTDEAERDT